MITPIAVSYTHLDVYKRQELERRTRGIEQRPKVIENRLLTAFAAQAPRRNDLLERRVIIGRKKKCEMIITQRPRRLFRRQVDFDAQRPEHVRAARLRRDGAVAVLGDWNAVSRGDNRHRCRNVECIETVAPGAAYVQNLERTRPGINRRFDRSAAPVSYTHLDVYKRQTVYSPDVQNPVAVRFGWANYPVVNLWSKAGLPASPFRTDDFAK